MVLRFRYAQAKSDLLIAAVESAIALFTTEHDSAPFELDGVLITEPYLRERFHLLDNLDLYIADDLHDELSGQMQKRLTSKGFCPWTVADVIHTPRGVDTSNVLPFRRY